jgi:hypothetical protein
MQCINCGRPLQPGETVCPNCGEPVLYNVQSATYPDDAPTWQSGGDHGREWPSDPNLPTIYGPPIGPDRYGRTGAAASAAPVARPTSRAAAPPPSTWRPARRAGRLRGIAALTALGLAIALFVGAFVASGQGLDKTLGFGTSPHHQPAATAGPTSTPTPPCPLPAVDPQSALDLTNVQLATGVRDAAGNDLRPIDNTATFVVGQSPYVTFQIATNQAGTIGATFCANGLSIPGNPLNVPRRYAGARGEFHYPSPLAAANVGPGAVVLTWNGVVAAALPFTVRSG